MAHAVRGADERVEFLHRSPSGPIAIVTSPFDWPQRPRRSWRLVGRWWDGSEFLIVLGATEIDAVERLEDSLAEFSNRDLNRIQTVRLERWFPGSRFEYPYWEFVRTVSLRTLRFKRVVRLQRRLKTLPFTPPRTKGIAS